MLLDRVNLKDTQPYLWKREVVYINVTVNMGKGPATVIANSIECLPLGHSKKVHTYER